MAALHESSETTDGDLWDHWGHLNTLPHNFFFTLASTHFHKRSFEFYSGLDAPERTGEKETVLVVTLG